jgi:deoxyribose-phosphate aldolase
MGIIKENVFKDTEARNGAKSKVEQAFEKYNLQVDDATVAAAVKRIIAEKVAENDTRDVKKFLLGSVELTSLHTTDTEESILAMVEKVNKMDSTRPDLPHVAAVCVFPVFVDLVRNSLEVDGVEITSVCGNFPSSQSRMEVKVAETQLAVADGATNVDIVLPVGKFLSEDYEGAADDISEMKQACGDVPMKVILETCDLGSLSNVKRAAILSMYAGADYIKTSTGKEKAGATPEGVYVMCQAIKEYYEQTGIMIGLKPAGGINTTMDAIILYTIAKEVLGDKWMTNEMFRLGTSRLATSLLEELNA